MSDDKPRLRPLFDQTFPGRLAEFLASGNDPMSYNVGTERLRDVVQVSKVNAGLKAQLLAFLEPHMAGLEVNTIKLGILLGEFNITCSDSDFGILVDDLRDLDKLPFSSIGGQTV